METFDKHFSQIIQETITVTCRENGFDKAQTKQFTKQFLGNMLTITQKVKLKLRTKGESYGRQAE